MNEKNILSVLLAHDVPKPQTKSFKIKRLSKLFGEDVVLEIKELSYSRVAEIMEMKESDVHTVLAGVVNLDFKDKDLKAKYTAETPAELVKAMLLPGEIAEIAREIERLSGYRTPTLDVIEETKKN
jgi:hypothetical protein